MKNIGLIGCGNISETYFRSQEYFNNINFVSCADINEENAKKCADIYKIKYQSVQDLLNDKTVDIILNLTNPISHYDVIKKTLESNKHSYCEKPMCINLEQAEELIKIAKEKNLYLGNAPDTFLGGGGQLSREIIDSNLLGDIKLGNFIYASPGLESWHPNPEPWFQKNVGGPVIDMCPYFFTMLVNLLGPAKNVKSHATTVRKIREIGTGPNKGKKFDVETPTSFIIVVEFISGAIIDGFISFDVVNHKRNDIELYGTKGSIIVPDPNMFGGPVYTSTEEGSNWDTHSTEKMELGKINIKDHSGKSNERSEQSNFRGVGLSEMIYSIENNIEHRCSGNLALHVLEIIQATIKSSEIGSGVELKTTCSKPAAFLKENINSILK